ncbi:hypothetical protein BXO88_01760 [Oribacterium sp. C9]|uniref:cyclic nucleotide-binding domain-containing protein n=1 Tax=Oribacterium sp. C9 TaxID=1943579 RepID=UPI00098F9D63|nr:cyclic nucleotide-binding domain-containing protein [Oribacterium sp. C9]OON87929.1 hypothetical protein BXO88_01760 [Oribacterium sp. C9]
MDSMLVDGVMRKYNDGDVIFHENEINPYMYKVLQGKVALYVGYKEPHENILGVLSEGKFFGEVSMLTGKPQVYTAVAIEDALLMKVGENQLEQFLVDNRSNMVGIMRSMAGVIVTQNRNISMLMNDIKEILSQIPKENSLDECIEMKLKQYVLKYVEKSIMPEEYLVDSKG